MRFRGRPHGFTTKKKPKKEYRTSLPVQGTDFDSAISFHLVLGRSFFPCPDPSTPPNANRCSISRLFRQVGNVGEGEKEQQRNDREIETVESHPGRGRDTRKADVETLYVPYRQNLHSTALPLCSKTLRSILGFIQRGLRPIHDAPLFPRIRNGDSIWVGVSGVSKETIDDSVDPAPSFLVKWFETILIFRYISVSLG